ncbi:hypothetical protein GOODEAATRI_023456 [Goodea atripinnis]|uniref:Uncharacterized protein n=1 Tax=Goodea atripinnis TaxID=208336 RepID=A0ABV0NCY5_9TELE
MTPTLSFLARSRTSASPLTLCAHQPHRRCSDRWRVTSSTPDITQRQHRQSSTPVCSKRSTHFTVSDKQTRFNKGKSRALYPIGSVLIRIFFL